jgi:2-oxoglutarate dehydrogenase E2 component (dihydrolipoamide succinyltransferase)
MPRGALRAAQEKMMRVELRVPAVGESITEVVVSVWHKQRGESVELDETVAEIESDKATLELPAPAAGVMLELLKSAGDSAAVGEVIGYIETEHVGATGRSPGSESTASGDQPSAPTLESTAPSAPVVADGATSPARIMPAAQRALAEAGLNPQQITPSGPGGRILKEDVVRALKGAGPDTDQAGRASLTVKQGLPARTPAPPTAANGEEEILPMSPIRRRIAERLMDAQHGAALLTTFNEVDMSAVIALRKQYQERFQERYGVKLGFMSFFVKAAVEALKLVPQVNAEIRGTDIIYKNHYDIGIAVGGGKGLVVPVLRGAHLLGFAQLELAIADFGARAKANKLDLEELKGGTFTISNGGVYGSLLSTPIVNPPQSGVLGLHAIQERAVVREGQIVIRPMMYVALTYDHRLIDGRESVTFLNRVKETVEDPARVLLEI